MVMIPWNALLWLYSSDCADELKNAGKVHDGVRPCSNNSVLIVSSQPD